MFRVRWERNALDELAEIWLAADSRLREAITAAAHEIDQQLKSAPDAAGESRPHGRRVLFVAPLGITFVVEHKERVVSVLRVWRFRRRGESE